MIAEQNLCVQCYEPITNPVCEACHAKEVELWIEDQNLTKSEKLQIMKEIKHAMPKEAMNENICILCGQNTLSTCSYCFFLMSAKVLKRLKVPSEITEEFLYSFDYRKGHNEYFE